MAVRKCEDFVWGVITFLHLVIEGKTSVIPTLAQSPCQVSRLFKREPIKRLYSAFMHAFHAFLQRLEPIFQPLVWLTSPKAKLIGRSGSTATPDCWMKELEDNVGGIVTRITKLLTVVNLVKPPILKAINVSLTSGIDVLSELR